VIRLFLIVEVAHAGNVRCVAVSSGPVDCFLLGLEGRQYVVGVIFNDEIGNRTSVQPPLRPWLDEYVRHSALPRLLGYDIANGYLTDGPKDYGFDHLDIQATVVGELRRWD
jgi:hypothetical protein